MEIFIISAVILGACWWLKRYLNRRAWNNLHESWFQDELLASNYASTKNCCEHWERQAARPNATEFEKQNAAAFRAQLDALNAYYDAQH